MTSCGQPQNHNIRFFSPFFTLSEKQDSFYKHFYSPHTTLDDVFNFLSFLTESGGKIFEQTSNETCNIYVKT